MPTDDFNRRMTYHPTFDQDYQGTKFGFEPVSNTLGRRLLRPGLYEVFAHANSKVVAWERNRDVSAQFKLIRLRRQWTGKLSGATPRPVVTHYTLETGASGPRGFGPDYGPDSWIDAPGQKSNGLHPGNVRYLQEFISGVGHPFKECAPIADFRGLYYIVAVDFTPDRYKVWMSLPLPLTPAQIEGALGIPGRMFPTDLIWEGAPNFEGMRYMATGWEEYSEFTGQPAPRPKREPSRVR
jgi:hypothetical protein